MQTCPECGQQTEGVTHNGRPLRCTFCFARLPETAGSPAVFGAWVPVEPETKSEPRRRGPETSKPAKAEAKPEIEKGKRK